MQSEEQSQSSQEQAEMQPANKSIDESKSVPVSGKICCPACGGTRIRTRSSFLWFPIAVAGLTAILLLQNVLILLPVNRYMRILSYCWMFVLCAAGIIVWIMLFRNSLCKSCGHRFPTKLSIRQGQGKTTFPLRFSFLNILLYLLGALTTASMLEDLFFNNASNYQIRAFWIVFACFFFAAISIPYHATVFFLLRKIKIKNQFLLAIIFVIPVILFRGDNIPYYPPEDRAVKILSYGRLADLPESAVNVKAYSWLSPFSGEWYLRFQANPGDIDKFINDSSSIKDLEGVTYSPEKMKIPYPTDREEMKELINAGHELYYPHSLAPKWYRPDIRIRGREYEIPPVKHHYNGEVIVDDEKNIVYIKIIWS